MAEGRIAHIVCQTSGTHDGTQFGQMGSSQFRMTLQQETAHVIAQAAAHTAHLQAVCEPVVHEDAAWQRKHLRLVLQATEGSREDQAVIIALEFRAIILAMRAMLLPEPLVGEQLSPFHPVCHTPLSSCHYSGL